MAPSSSVGTFKLDGDRLYHFPHNSAYREELDFMLKLLDPRKTCKRTYTLAEICKIMLIGEIRAKNFRTFHKQYHSNFTKYPPPDMPSLTSRFGPREARKVARKRHKVFMKFQKAPKKYYDELCKVQYKAKSWLGNWVEFPRDYCDFAAYCGLLPAYFKNPFASKMEDGYVVSDLMISYLDGKITLEEILMGMKYANASINLDRYKIFNIEVRPFYSCLRILQELSMKGINKVDYIMLSATVACLRSEKEIPEAVRVLESKFHVGDAIINDGSLSQKFQDEAGRFSLALLKFLNAGSLIAESKDGWKRYISITQKGKDLIEKTPGNAIFYGHAVSGYQMTPLLGNLLNLFEEKAKAETFSVQYTELLSGLSAVITKSDLDQVLEVIQKLSPSPIKSITESSIELNPLSHQYAVNPTTDFAGLSEVEFVTTGVGSVHPGHKVSAVVTPPKKLIEEIRARALASDGDAYEDIIADSLEELKVGKVVRLGHKMRAKRVTDTVWEVPVIDSITSSDKKLLVLIDAKAGGAIKALDERALIDDLKRTLEMYRARMEEVLGVWVWVVDSDSLPTEGGHGGPRPGVKSFMEKLHDVMQLMMYVSRPMIVSALNVYCYLEYYSYLYNILPKIKGPLNEVMSVQFWTWGTLFKPVKDYVFVLNDHNELKRELFIPSKS